MPKAYMKDSISSIPLIDGLCEVETFFFPPTVKTQFILALKTKEGLKNYLFLNNVQNNSG